ncbi:hypothetical protein JCM24511_01747 [Saitozyma sp. JCM 24511]|nr:hypothetical protein JCM24511_01747 [Saitozyma sp. JCM 24511]
MYYRASPPVYDDRTGHYDHDHHHRRTPSPRRLSPTPRLFPASYQLYQPREHPQLYHRNFAPPPPRRPGNAPAPEPNPVLGVFGLSIRTRERDLEDEFMRYGDVDKVTIVYDQRASRLAANQSRNTKAQADPAQTDRSRGFGFITMRSIEDAGRCIEKLNGMMLHGRAIRVDYSATQKPHAPTPGEYKGEKRPLDDRYSGGGRYDRYDDRRGGRGGYDDRGYGRDRYDDRDRYRDRDSYAGSSRRDEDPYGGRSRRDDDRRRSPSPRRSRYSASPERRPPPASRDYDEPADSASRS